MELKGARNEAIAEYEKAQALSDDPRVLASIGHAYASTGEQKEAREILARLTEMARTRYVAPYSFAVIYLTLGEKDQALEFERMAKLLDGFIVSSGEGVNTAEISVNDRRDGIQLDAPLQFGDGAVELPHRQE